jgi:PAS domain S-box-containing protein
MKTDSKPKAKKSPLKTNGKHPLAAYEHIPVGIVEASLDGNYMDVNEEICRMLGYSRTDLLQRGIKDCTYEEDYAIDAKLYEQLIDGKIPFYRIEKRFVRKDETLIWAELTRSLVCDAKGKPLYTVGVVLDISDRKDVEKVLHDSVERLRLATGAAQMFMWEWDFQTQSYIIEDSFEQVLGFSGGLLPKNSFETVWALSPKEDIQFISENFEKAVENQRDLHAVPCRVVNPENGKVVWLEISAKIVYDREGKPERMFGVAQNITESKQIENAFRESEERFRAMVSQTTAGIGESDREGRFIFVNSGFCEMLGYSETELLGKTIWELTYTEDLEENRRLFTRMLEQGQPYQLEKRFLRKEGSRLWANVSVTTIHDLAGNAKGGVGVILDIGKRKEAEAALAEYARQQEALYRLTDQLQRTGSLAEVFDASLDAILNALQCNRASILLFDEADVMRFVAWRGLSDAYRKATEGHSPWTADARNPQPVVMDAVRTAALTESLRAVIQAEGIGSLAFIPLVSNEKLIGKFMVYFDTPHRFNEGEIDLSLTIARQLATAIDRKRAEKALARERELLERLFETMPVMVSIIDPESNSMRLNAEFERRIGWKSDEVTVLSLIEALYPDPDYRQDVLERMANAGRNEWVEVQVHTREGRTMDSMWSNISIMNDQKLVTGIAIGIDITERKQTEKRLALLAEISEMLRNVDDPYELMYRISESIGKHLQVKRVLFNEIDLDHDLEIVHRDYHHGLETAAGAHKISDYSSITSEEMATGKTVVNTDSKTDLRTAHDYEKTYALSRERSYVAVPLMRDNRWVASLWVSDDAPRKWTNEEVSLLETVAERTWAIIEKLRIHKALRESELRFREMIDALPAAIYTTDAEGILTHFNPAAVEFSGRTPKVGIDKWCVTWKLYYPDGTPMPHEECPMALTLKEGRMIRGVEAIAERPDGSRIWFEPYPTPLLDEEGRVVGGINMLVNITERKRAEEALRASEQRYRAVVESQAEMLCRFQPDGTILFVNGAYARARGTTPEELTDRNFWEFVAEEDRQAVKAMLDHLTPESPQVQIENRFQTMEGERWTLWTNRALHFDEHGRLLEVQSSGIDITERKQFEEALRASEERMRLATDAAGMYTWEYDIQNQLFTPSDNFAEVIGILPDLVLENDIDALGRLSHPEDSQNVQKTIEKVFDSGEDLRDMQYRIVNPENEQVIWMEVNARTIYDREGKPERMYGVSQNVTERKRIEAALRESEERYRFIVENTSDGIWWVELTEPMPITLPEDEQIDWYYKHAVMRQCNLGLARMYGYDSIEDVVGLPMRTFMPRQIPANLELSRQFVRSGYRLVDAESREVNADGRELVFLNNMVGIVERGKLVGEWGTNRDITERKRAEEALRRNEQMFFTLMDAAPFGVYFIDSDFRLRSINKGAEAVFSGIAPLIGRDFAEILRIVWQEPFATEAIERFRHTLRTGEPFISPPTVEPRANIDEIEAYDWQIHRITLSDGTFGVVCYFYDLSEQKRMEAAVRASEALYRTIARNIPGGGVYVVDKDFRYLVAEGPVTEAFGLTRDMLEGRTVTEAFPGERGERMEARLLQNFAGETVSYETEHQGHIYWTQQAPLSDSIGQVIILTLDITERKRAEEALRQSEERFAHFMQHLPGLAWIKDTEGRYLYANAAAEKAFHTPRASLYGSTDEDIFPPEIAAQFRENDVRALTAAKGIQVIETLMHDDGVLHHSLVSKFPIPGPDGATALIGGTAFDITERLRAEEALLESEERFRALLRQATAGVVRKDPEGRLIFVNEAFCNMLGYTEADLIGKTVWEFMHPDDVEENRRSYERLILDGIPFKLERRFLRRDGSVIWVDASVSPIMDAKGKPQSAVAVEVDITGRKLAEDALRELNLQLEERVLSRTAKLRAVNQTLREEIAERRRVEEALRESEARARANEEKLSTVFELLPVGISFLNPEGQIIQVNPALAHMMKLSKDQLTDRSYASRKYIRPNGTIMPPTEFASQRALNEGKTVYSVETGLLLDDGEVVWTSVSAAPVHVAEVGAIMVTTDITDRKRAERALQESRERLQVLSQRLVEVQEEERRAIARELHDRVGQTLAALNINLIIISGQLGGNVEEQVSARLADSMKLVAETIALVRDVMSNLRPSVLDDYGLESAIDSHLAQFTSRYGIRVRFEKPGQLLPRLGPSVEMTFLRIAQEALMNIAKHAQADQVTLSLQREGNTIYMTIQDNGSGITSWQEANRPGSHGLTIMRERAEAFGGHLNINSIPGKGTKVEVRIPVETNDQTQPQEEKRE